MFSFSDYFILQSFVFYNSRMLHSSSTILCTVSVRTLQRVIVCNTFIFVIGRSCSNMVEKRGKKVFKEFLSQLQFLSVVFLCQYFFSFLFYQKARLLPPGGALILTARLGLPKLSLYPPAINNKEFMKVMVLLLMTAIRSIYTQQFVL